MIVCVHIHIYVQRNYVPQRQEIGSSRRYRQQYETPPTTRKNKQNLVLYIRRTYKQKTKNEILRGKTTPAVENDKMRKPTNSRGVFFVLLRGFRPIC